MSHPYADFDETGTEIVGTDGNVVLKSGTNGQCSSFLSTDETDHSVTVFPDIKLKVEGSSLTRNVNIGTNQTTDVACTDTVQIGNDSSVVGFRNICIGDNVIHESADDAICIGTNSTTNGFGTVAIGLNAESKAFACISIGQESGTTVYNQNANVNIGYRSGNSANVTQSVHIGNSAGQNQTSSTTDRVLIGRLAGNSNCASQAIGIGAEALQNNAGIGAVGVGYRAGVNNSGTYGISIGYGANSTGTGQTNIISIGYAAGGYNSEQNSINIGYFAGYNRGSTNSVNIGYQAGRNGSGDNNVLIGYQAGYSNNNNKHRTIVLNATGNDLSADGTDRFFVKPVRNQTDLTGLLQLYYNPTTGEITYN
jgi:hypothetical protein